MLTKTIVLPSGLSGEIRNMKAKELAYLADPSNGSGGKGGKKSKKTHPLDPVLNGCWLKTLSAGPYGFSEGEPVPWGKVLAADRFVLFVHIRALTWGNFEWRVRCKSPTCARNKKPFVWELDLADLDYKDFPKATLERIKENQRVFDITIGGLPCKHKLLNGDEEANAKPLSEDMAPHKKLLASVALGLVEIDGKPVDPESEEALDWVGELDLPELARAQKAMESVNGGVETTTMVTCPDCGLEFVTDVPFADQSFLSPIQK